jgi:recombination associated protein RdgC
LNQSLKRVQVFKNMIVYRVGPEWSATMAQIEEGLDAGRFVECGSTQEKSIGWREPRGEANGPLVESVGGQLILKLMIETRALPGAVVTRKAKERVAHIEATTGRKPGKKEIRDIKDDIRLELLPMAFTKQVSVGIWIDPKARLLVIDAASQARTDDVVTMLVKSVPGLAVTLLNTKLSPTSAMAEWLISQEAPAGFSVDRECELKAADESKAVVRYARHPLDNDEVRKHVQAGKLPTRLALTWGGRVSFVLTENLQIKKLAFLDVVFDSGAAGKDDGFDADVAIATGELRKLLPDLLEALGGEMVAA